MSKLRKRTFKDEFGDEICVIPLTVAVGLAAQSAGMVLPVAVARAFASHVLALADQVEGKK